MSRWMSARRSVTCEPDELIDRGTRRLPELLQAATGQPLSPPDGDGGIVLRLDAPVGGKPSYKLVRAWVGEQEVAPGWVSVPLRMKASPGASFFPSFDGRIEFEPTSPDTVTLMLIGRYEPPLGPVGDVLDRTVFNHRAEETAQWLVDRLARELSDDHPRESTRRARGQLRVRDVMTTDPIVFSEDQPLRAAADVMLRGRFSGAAVLDTQGRAVGVLSERDLLEKAATWPGPSGRTNKRARQQHRGVTVGDLCTRPACTTDAATSVRHAAREMADRDVDRLVVLDGAVHVGIITRTDVLRALARDEGELEDAVRDVLGRLDAADVHATVRDGVVELSGQTEMRSTLRVIVMLVGEVDGVIDVRFSDLGWRIDDLAAAHLGVVPPL